MKPTYISWAPYCSRSDNAARELGGRSYMVYRGSLGSNPVTVALKYIIQAFDTFRILRKDRPDAVFVMSPPPIAVLVVWMYCLLHRVPYVVDAHSAAFLHPRWRRLQWLHNGLCRGAATTIVTNEHLARRLSDAGAHATVIRDVPIEYDTVDAFEPEGAFCVAVTCSFNADEPLAEIIRAAADVSEVRFYVTGENARLDMSQVPPIPANVTFTGFLPEAAYGSLLARSQAVLTLTTRDHTMLRGAYEAVYQGTPVIVSDWPLLREAFSQGAVFCDNTVSGIAAAVREMRARHERYAAAVLALREQKRAEWQRSRPMLLSRLAASRRSG